jgi:hypothetical protein
MRLRRPPLPPGVCSRRMACPDPHRLRWSDLGGPRRTSSPGAALPKRRPARSAASSDTGRSSSPPTDRGGDARHRGRRMRGSRRRRSRWSPTPQEAHKAQQRARRPTTRVAPLRPSRRLRAVRPVRAAAELTRCARLRSPQDAYAAVASQGAAEGLEATRWRLWVQRVVLDSVLTCPSCGVHATETMPEDACQYFYDCTGCGVRLRPGGRLLRSARTEVSGARPASRRRRSRGRRSLLRRSRIDGRAVRA